MLIRLDRARGSELALLPALRTLSVRVSVALARAPYLLVQLAKLQTTVLIETER
ncbi:hypothetical protein SRHO_G00291020 [Serrasalmus rhombeus]